MENKIIKVRLEGLRKAMKTSAIDFYMIPTADFHNSEYVNDYFKVREFFSSFTGSNGTLVVWADGAGLWTDGRYFIQAARELEGTGVTLFRMGEEGVPSILEFLDDQMQKGQVLGFDGRVVSASMGLQYEKRLEKKDIKVSYEKDLALSVWEERPMLPSGATFVLPDEIAGRSINEKLSDVRTALKKAGAVGYLLTKLDDIMWLFNIRGCDVECNPVALSYAYVDQSSSLLFMQEKSLNESVKEHLVAGGVTLREYGDILPFLEGELVEDTSVLADKRHCNYTLFKKLQKRCRIVEKDNPTEKLKAVKNAVELSNMEAVYLMDSVALTKFIYWLKENVGKTQITEVSAADYLESLRREIPGFLDLSFPTIAGYKENAAMMHYEATQKNYAVLEADGMLLVDSGGQYMGGTTDVTRTIVLGSISEEIKRHYTAVVSGMLQLTRAKWLYGSTGRNLDILARQPLWDIGIDYKCGTGHGIGYILNVHEGPQNIRWKFIEGMVEAVLEEGMDISNEPGVYIEGSHGIRIENIMVVKKDEKNGDGQFMCFDTLTYVPIDLEAIDVQSMTVENLNHLNRYHQSVYEKLSPFLSEEEKEWLKVTTRVVEKAV